MSTNEITTLVTPEMETRKGQWGNEHSSPPIGLTEIRRWAIAVYWPETPPRLYWDEDYAKTTRFGGIIAPEDFNPFAWPVERVVAPERASATSAGPGMRGMNGGQVDTYGVPMRPGDIITSRSRLRDWDERTTRLGLTLFTYNETEWHNQKGELVKRRVQTGIRY